MKVSIIIPVYNVERYLARCLDSVIDASRKLLIRDAKYSVEIICVNDGSTDGSTKILSKYADKVKIIEKPNGGLGSARNAGLDIATGDYIMFVDSDDFIARDALVKFVVAAESSNAPIVVSTSFAKDTLDSRRGRLPVGDWKLRPAKWIAGKKVQYSAWNKLYKAELFKARRYPTTIYEDFPVTTGIFCDINYFAAIDEPLYIYCTNDGASSLVRSPLTKRKVTDSLTVIRMVLEYVEGMSMQKLKFARHQAADGLSSTIGQVYKAKNVELTKYFLGELEKFFDQYPEMHNLISLKAKVRLWIMARDS